MFRKFISSPQHPDQLWTHPAASPMGSTALSLGVKQLGHGADCIPSYVELKNFWNYISTLFSIFMTWCLIKYKDIGHS
jgi:hypothetical protein